VYKLLKKCLICKQELTNKELITSSIYGDTSKKKKFYKCKSCEVIFQEPYFTKKQELKFYQKEFEKFMSSRSGVNGGWENATNHIKSNNNTYHRRIKFLKKNLKSKQDILEIGCSSGFMLFPLIKKNINCFGVEPSLVFYNFLKKKKIKVFKSLDSLKKNYPDQKFDIIMHFFVLEHIADPKNFFLEQLKLLKKNGKIILEVPCYSDALYTLYNIKSFQKFYWSLVHPWYFNMKSLKILLDQINVKYRIKYHQRYSIANHLTWATKGKPGSSKTLENLLGDKINNIYKKKLQNSGFADTLIAEISK
jgi:SAM-dependent methyltransferase